MRRSVREYAGPQRPNRARARARPEVSKDFSWEVMRENATWNETADTHAYRVSVVHNAGKRFWKRPITMHDSPMRAEH